MAPKQKPRKRSLGVHVPNGGILKCLALLPVSVITKNSFLEYPKMHMKLVPAWEKMVPFTECPNELLNQSGGRQVLHSSMMPAVVKFASDLELAFTNDKIEKGGYALRVMISQVRNMRTADREIPKRWQPKFQFLVDKMVYDEGADGEEGEESEEDENGVAIISVLMDDPNEVEVIQSSPDVDEEALWYSSDPELQALLAQSSAGSGSAMPTKRRCTKKTRDQERSAPALGSIFSVSELSALVDDVDLDPKEFAALNKAKKQLEAEKGKKPKPANANALPRNLPMLALNKIIKKPANANALPKSSLLHRCYSGAYHKEKRAYIRVGLDRTEALRRARLAGQKATEELMNPD